MGKCIFGIMGWGEKERGEGKDRDLGYVGDGITYTIYSNKSELQICKLAYFISEIHKSNSNKKKRYKTMTLEALQQAIANLLVARREAHGNEAEQARINAKLDKLYNLKYTLLEQESQKK